MWLISIKMLLGDKAKYMGIILGLSFASFIIVQQASIFTGLMARTYGFIQDTSQPDIWVMDEKVQFIDDIKPLKETQLYYVKGIEGVKWAVPFYKGLLKAKLSNGHFQICNIIGIDNATLIGAPPVMVEGKPIDLREPDAIIVNEEGCNEKLSSNGKNGTPLQVGEVIEINDHRAKVVGICKSTPTFQSQPVVYTTYNRASTFAPVERNLLSFILVKTNDKKSTNDLCEKINKTKGLIAYTSEDFKRKTVEYYMKNTGIPINFGIAVLLGLVIGMAISGQTFYNFIVSNHKYLATLKAMGAKNNLITKIVLIQALWVGLIGWGIGVGCAGFFGLFSNESGLSFLLIWQVLLGSGVAIFSITVLSALLSLKKIYNSDPAIIFQGK